MKYFLKSLVWMCLVLLLIACNDENYNAATSAIFPSAVEITVPSGKEVYEYTDDDVTVFPMVTGDTLALGYSISPDSATYKDVTWSTSDASVATVNSNGVVTARSSGTAIITITPVAAYSGSGIASTLKIAVSESITDADSITLSSSADSVYVGETVTITPTFSPSTTTYKSVKFTSSNESIATVTNKGVVTGISGSGEGKEVIITATALDNSGITVSKSIRVLTIVNPESITLDKTYISSNYDWSIGEKTYTISYSATPTDCTKSLIDWTSSDESIATVSNGVVTFNQSGVFGTVTITATCPTTGNYDAITLNLAAGKVRELFHNSSNIQWNIASGSKTSGATSTWNYGYIKVTTYAASSTAQRADFSKADSYVWINTGNYPIFAIKMNDVLTDYASSGVTARNITFDTSSSSGYKGSVGGGSNKWSTRYKCSDGSYVFIYDLSSLSFATGGVLPTTSTYAFSTFQFKYADIKTISTSVTYNVYWVQTFKTLSDVQAYLTSEGLTWE